MKKILFTDLVGTLISPDMDIQRKFFNSTEKEYEIIGKRINEFLREGNYVVIVTEPGGHGTDLSIVFNRQLSKLNYYIDEDLRSSIIYYIRGYCNIRSEDHIYKKTINGKTYYTSNYPFKGIAVDKKEEAITDFLQNIHRPYQIYGIGDTHKDIPMLLKVEEMGGKSAFIDTYLYREGYGNKKTIDQIIKNELHIEFHFELKQAIKNTPLEYRKEDKYSEETILLLEKREKRKEELYQLLYKGKLDLDLLDRNYSKFIECSNYEDEYFSNYYTYEATPFYENYPFNEKLVQDVMNMPCYSSFSEYYTKVLKRN